MKDSQRERGDRGERGKYIKANNERFSTPIAIAVIKAISISRRIMKDSQHRLPPLAIASKYIKANNERFSTHVAWVDAVQ